MNGNFGYWIYETVKIITKKKKKKREKNVIVFYMEVSFLIIYLFVFLFIPLLQVQLLSAVVEVIETTVTEGEGDLENIRNIVGWGK